MKITSIWVSTSIFLDFFGFFLALLAFWLHLFEFVVLTSMIHLVLLAFLRQAGFEQCFLHITCCPSFLKLFFFIHWLWVRVQHGTSSSKGKCIEEWWYSSKGRGRKRSSWSGSYAVSLGNLRSKSKLFYSNWNSSVYIMIYRENHASFRQILYFQIRKD